MKFIKLHYNGRELLANMSLVTDIHKEMNCDKSILYLNFLDDDGVQAAIAVDETLDEIYEKLKEKGE